MTRELISGNSGSILFAWRWGLALLVFLLFGCGVDTTTQNESHTPASTISKLRSEIADLRKELASLRAEMREKITTKDLVVVDSQGKTRALLSVDADGNPMLAMSDTKEKPRAVLSISSDGRPVLGMYDEQGKNRTGLTLADDGSPLLKMSDAQGQTRAGLSVSSDGSPLLKMSDAQGEGRAMLSVSSSGRPVLGMADAEGNPRAGLGLEANGSPKLGMSDAQGSTRAFLVLAADGTPAMGMSDAQGKMRFNLNLVNGSPWLGMYDAQERPRASLDLDDDGTPAMTLRDAQRPRAEFSARDDATLLLLSDTQGTVRTSLSTSEKKGDGLAFYDANGRLRCVLGAGKESEALSFLDEQGNNPVRLEASEGKATLFLAGGQKKELCVMLTARENGPLLALYDPQSSADVQLSPQLLQMHDTRGATRVILTAKDDEPGLALYDTRERIRALLTGRDEGARISIRNAFGNAIWSEP